MANIRRNHGWLPKHQEHVVYTLAHADDLIARVGDILFDYLKKPGPLRFENVADGELTHTKVTAIAPLPSAVSRYAADVLTQLRAAVEHTLFAEVEYRLGRKLSDSEARQIEMPASADAEGFTRWLKVRRRKDLPPLREGSELCKRIRDLQPYRQRDVDDHPLRLLAEHTNLAKHRTPVVASTRLGTVRTDDPTEALVRTAGGGTPLRIGDVLATGPRGRLVPISIWPNISIQRPHTGSWHTLVKELGEIEKWVRTTAIPTLIAGTRSVPPLPPQIDIKVGYSAVDKALAASRGQPAGVRALQRLKAETARQSIREILVMFLKGRSEGELAGWLDSLSDGKVLDLSTRFLKARQRSLGGLSVVCGGLVSEARQKGWKV